MKFEVFSYRYGREILEHDNFRAAWEEIDRILRKAPVFVYPKKSQKKSTLDVVQQLMNLYFDRVFAIEDQWQYHPLATNIEDSQLRADFRKQFAGRHSGSITVQAEVQFGNMSRWYTDLFKYQTAYSQKLITVGLSIIPMKSLAQRIDQNVVNFERATKELPSADLSITLPIVVVGVDADPKSMVDVSKCRFKELSQITGRGMTDNRRRIIHAFLCNRGMSSVSTKSDVGPEFPQTNVLDDE